MPITLEKDHNDANCDAKSTIKGRRIVAFKHVIDSLNDVIGRYLSWLTLVMAILVVVVVATRSLFDAGSTALQESVTYLHATLFMLCLAYTAKEGGHVRVDIFYRRFSTPNKAWVNAVGALIFLLPFSLFLLFISAHFVIESWSIQEGSINPGGINAVFLLKTLLPLAGILLGLHALSELLSNALCLTYTASNLQSTSDDDKQEGPIA